MHQMSLDHKIGVVRLKIGKKKKKKKEDVFISKRMKSFFCNFIHKRELGI